MGNDPVKGENKMSTYVVFDLEMCKVQKGMAREKFPCARELIEIGAVAMNENYEIIDSFRTYVKPEHGRIDPYIKNLTGITQADVSNAPTADIALKSFYNWLPPSSIFVTWSGHDIKQIEREIKYKSIDLPELYNYLGNSIDCQVIFSEKMSTKSAYRLSEALSISNIDYDESIHTAYADAKNTALLFAKTQVEEVLILSPYFMKKEELYMNRFDSFTRL